MWSFSKPTPPPERPLNILTFDGGGVRGLSSLLILREIMDALTTRAESEGITWNENWKPCDIFDLMAGSSTGGLSALMLGRLRLSVDQCIDEYCALASKVFGDPEAIKRRTSSELLEQEGTVYNSELLAETMRSIVERYATAEGDTGKLSDPKGADACKTFVLAVSPAIVDGPPIRFRTYRSSFGRTEQYHIWEAARATTAARPFFDFITMGYPAQKFMDAMLGHNNPTAEALNEVREIWGKDTFTGRKSDRPIGCVLSIGTGMLDLVKLAGNAVQLQKAYKDILTNCDRVANDIQRRLQPRHQDASKSPYVRLSVSKGLEDIPLDEWTRLDGENGLTGITRSWINEPEIQDKIDKCTTALMARVRELAAPPKT